MPSTRGTTFAARSARHPRSWLSRAARHARVETANARHRNWNREHPCARVLVASQPLPSLRECSRHRLAADYGRNPLKRSATLNSRSMASHPRNLPTTRTTAGPALPRRRQPRGWTKPRTLITCEGPARCGSANFPMACDLSLMDRDRTKGPFAQTTVPNNAPTPAVAAMARGAP